MKFPKNWTEECSLLLIHFADNINITNITKEMCNVLCSRAQNGTAQAWAFIRFAQGLASKSKRLGTLKRATQQKKRNETKRNEAGTSKQEQKKKNKNKT